MELKRVVVTGIGALTPLGNNTNEYWDGLLNGVSGADFITLFDASKFKTRFACEVKNFDPVQFMDKKEARKIDRFSQFALVVSDEAQLVVSVGMVSMNRIHDNSHFVAPVEYDIAGGSHAVAITEALIDREVRQHHWVPNDPIFLPSHMLIRMPEYQSIHMWCCHHN